jgi:hypothetical protein
MSDTPELTRRPEWTALRDHHSRWQSLALSTAALVTAYRTLRK